MRIAVLYSRVRIEEKLLFAALQSHGVEFGKVNTNELAFAIGGGEMKTYDAVLVRCISHSQAYYATRWLAAQGVLSVSSHQAVATCGDKMLTSAALQEAGLPIPRTMVGLSAESALVAIEQMGYPVVLKPVFGSWGRLLARVNDLDAAEALLEHKSTLGGPTHGVFYIQEYIDKPARDIRVIVAGNEVVCAVYRRSEHWITNTARGAGTEPCPVSSEIASLSLAAAAAVGGGILAVDLLESTDGRMLVNEVNHTPEFHGAMQAATVDIAGKMVDYLLHVAKEGK